MSFAIRRSGLVGRALVGALVAAIGLVGPSRGGAQESPYLYGIHDHDTGQQEYLDHISNNIPGGGTGWVTATVAIGSNPNDTGGDNFTSISNQGHTVVCRLNNGYSPNGTIPEPAKYGDFAQRCANYVAASQGCDIWIIGNETNLAHEWPIVNGTHEYVSPEDYADCFRQCYDAIKAVSPNAKVLFQALAPFAGPYGTGSINGTPHDAQPLNWVQYMNQCLTTIKGTGGVDGIALHINSRGYTVADIHSTQQINANGQNLYWSFYVYKDWIDHGIPSDLYHLPLYATECNGIYYWKGGHPENPSSSYTAGWMQEIYAEIDQYNQGAIASGKPVFRCVNMYRWCSWCDGWNIDGAPQKGQILTDLDEAASVGYTWPTSPPPPQGPPAGSNVAGGSGWTASSTFSSSYGGDKAIDGVISAASKWTSDGASSSSWLALDLGAKYDVTGFIVRHAGDAGESSSYNTTSFRLESADASGGPWTILSTVDNSSGADTSTTVLSNVVSTQHVRLFITDAGIDDYARIPELEVFSTGQTPLPPPPIPPGDNVALAAVNWTASSSFSPDNGGDKAYDGVLSAASKWTSDGSSAESWLALDLGQDSSVNGFVVRHAGSAGESSSYNTAAFRIESCETLQGPWTELASVVNSSGDDESIIALQDPVVTQHVRLYITDAGIDNYARIPEFEVYGDEYSPPGVALVNGDFEGSEQVDGVGDGWTGFATSGYGATFDIVTSTVHGGAQSQLVNAVQPSGSDRYAGVYQGFGANASTDYTINAWNRTSLPGGGQFDLIGRLGIDLTGGSDFQSGNVTWYEFDSAKNAWHNLQVTVTATGPSITIFLQSWRKWASGGSGSCWFDDVTVSGQAPPPPNNPPVAVATASPTSGNAPLAVSFDASGSSDPDSDPLTFSWDFGDSSSGSGATPSHTYNAAGSFTATVTVEDGNGGCDQASVPITVNEESSNRVTNGDFSGGLASWSVWTERGTLNETVTSGQAHVSSTDHNGGLWQQFQTGGAGSTVTITGTWASDPTVASYQWAEVLVIDGTRLPVNGQDINDGQSDVEMIYKNDTWATSGGWSGDMDQTAPVANNGSFVASGDVATLILKSGNVGGTQTSGTRFDDILVTTTPGTPPPPSTTVPPKIGFHMGPGGNANGIGDYMDDLDAAGIPFVIKSADAAGTVFEGAQLRAASGVPHVLVYRKSVGSGWNPDVPDYNKTPAAAAAEHWQRHRDAFPPELLPYKDIVWLETINEIDKNRAEWLGEFAVETANLALAEGFNWLAFGWSSGEPEREHWEGPWMLQYLQMCAANPTRLGVALHEYSYVLDGLDRDFPSLVGRFQMLFDVCDQNSIGRPTIVMTEFGWVYDDVPGAQQVTDVDLPWASELYAPHPEILGAAIWYLGPGFGGIANKAQQLIAPVTDFMLNTTYEIGQ